MKSFSLQSLHKYKVSYSLPGIESNSGVRKNFPKTIWKLTQSNTNV